LSQKKEAACSWSSGKDSCLALYKAKREGYKISYLFNFISREYKRVSFHGAPAELVSLQAEALGIPLIQKETTKDNYEEVFRKTLEELKEKNIHQIVRGDIHLLDLRDWVEDICSSQGMTVISPLWNKPVLDILKEFIDCGFKAIITSTQASKLDQNWISRIIDEKFIQDLSKIKEVDLCGENGEFHSFVYDGPIFVKKIDIVKTEKVMINGYWFLDIQKYKLQNKGEIL